MRLYRGHFSVLISILIILALYLFRIESVKPIFAYCNNYTFNSGSVAPGNIDPGGNLTVQCNFGAIIDCINPNSISQSYSGCVWNGWTGFNANFTCTAPNTAGTYTNRCSLITGTGNDCCAQDNDAGTYSVNSPTPTITNTPTSTNTPTPTNTPTATPFYYRCNNAACEIAPGTRQEPPFYADCNGQPAGWCSTCTNLPCTGDGDCDTQGGSACSGYVCVGGICTQPTNTPTPTFTPTPTGFNLYGWVYKETNSSVNRAEEEAEGLIAGLQVDLYNTPITPTPSIYIGQYSTSGSSIGSYLGNYLFSVVNYETYMLDIPITPTGYVLYEGYTNPQYGINVYAMDTTVDFPFVTEHPPLPPETPIPTNTITPTKYPTVTITPGGPTLTPTITPGGPTLTPTVSITPGGPSLTPTPTDWVDYPPTPTDQLTPTSILTVTPASCLGLPTPVLAGPNHTACLNAKPTFAAIVSDPNQDNAWARYVSNSFESFNRIGSILTPPYNGYSTWTPYTDTLNMNGGYWWTARTQSSTCPSSADAPSRLLNMDYTAPPVSNPPSCVKVNQDLYYTGVCTFRCTWEQSLETDNSCANTSSYHPFFWTDIDRDGYDPGWIGQLSIDVYTDDGSKLYSQVQARDSIGNTSNPSTTGGPFTCPKINSPTLAISPTPSNGPSPTPTLVPTSTITPTPSPGNWIQIEGGDIYGSSIINTLPNGQTMLIHAVTTPMPNSAGIIRYAEGGTLPNSGYLSSRQPDDWKVSETLSNIYNFSYYWELLGNTGKEVNKVLVGSPADLTNDPPIYKYSGQPSYQLDPNFNPGSAETTIFLVSGSLEIGSNYILDFSDKTIVFIVNGNITIDSDVTDLSGVFITSDMFAVSFGGQRFNLNGMIYGKRIQLNRHNPNYTVPTYKIIYKPKYLIDMISFLGNQQVKWQEVAP